MTTDKRARQKANRASRVAAAEAAEAKARTRTRLINYGTIFAVIVVAIVGFAILTADDDSDTGADPSTTDPPASQDTTPTVAPFDPALVDWVYPEFDTEISADCPRPTAARNRRSSSKVPLRPAST